MAEAELADQPKKRDVRKILSIAFTLLNFLIVGGGAYLVYAGTLGHEYQSTTNNELMREIASLRASLQTKPVIYQLDAFNTNLEGLPRRFIRLEMAVEMYDQEGFEEIVTSGGETRDSIMRIVNSKRLQDIDTVQGKLALKSELMAKINQQLNRGVVKDLYFTKFQVQ